MATELYIQDGLAYVKISDSRINPESLGGRPAPTGDDRWIFELSDTEKLLQLCGETDVQNAVTARIDELKNQAEQFQERIDEAFWEIEDLSEYQIADASPSVQKQLFDGGTTGDQPTPKQSTVAP